MGSGHADGPDLRFVRGRVSARRLSRRRLLGLASAAGAAWLTTPVRAAPAVEPSLPVVPAPADAVTPTPESGVEARPTARQNLKVFRTAYLSDIVSLDSAHITSALDAQIGEAIYNLPGRYTYDPPLSNDIRPEAATWDVEDDARTFTFRLRRGIQFHAGYGELTADDLKWHWQRIADKQTGSRFYTDFATAEVSALDSHTLRVRFPSPFPAFIAGSAAYVPGLMMSRRAFEDRGDRLKTEPIGSGPFEWESWQPGAQVTLKRFDGYWGQQPKIDKIEIKVRLDDKTAVLAVAKGELDAHYLNDPDIAADLARSTPPTTRFFKPDFGNAPYWLAFNMKRRPFDDIRVRHALRYAIDTEAIARDLYGGLADPIASFMPPFMFGYTADVPQFRYDPDRARQLLQEAGVPADWSPGLLGDATQVHARKIHEAVNSFYNDVGIKSRVELAERATFLQRRASGDYDVFGIGVGRIEPDSMATPYWRSDSPVNNAFYTGADDLIDRAKAEPDPNKRAQIYHELQRRISEDSPAAFIVATASPLLVHRRVSGIAGAGLGVRFDWFNVDVANE